MPKSPKHVIFLGAGASYSSGYPLGDDLRKHWLASADGLRRKLTEALGNHSLEEDAAAIFEFDLWIEPFEQSLRLFREGCFGTIDEFCYHIRDAQSSDVRKLKAVLRFVFGIQNPEKQFEHSDYYRFIQKLFVPNDLKSLREDVVVMSFNYDPYLEWLLRRAYRIRKHALNPTSRTTDFAADSTITSGFSGGLAGVKHLRESDGFCLLKLHGIAAWPNSGTSLENTLKPHCSFESFFDPIIQNRIMSLTSDGNEPEVPILFPWEIFGSNGDFLEADKFPLKDEIHEHQDQIFRLGGRTPIDPSLHDIFRAIWTRARDEVQSASKISFVGLSMHEYLNTGFKYLFQGKEGKVQLAVTDKSSIGRTEAQRRNPSDSLSPASRVNILRDNFCPGMGWGEMRLSTNFEEFILKELGPLK